MAQVTDLYKVLSQVRYNRYDPALQEAVDTYEVRALWNPTGSVLTVYVPAATYSATEVDTLIRNAGQVSSEVAALGAGSPRSS